MSPPIRYSQLSQPFGPGLVYTPHDGTSESYDAVLIFMHGLGDDATGWSDGLRELSAQLDSPQMKLILPTAPQRPISLMGGMETSAWADLEGLTPTAPEDVSGWKASASRIRNIIDFEIRENKISAKRIFLGGFSQGGAVALLAGLNYPQTLGGLVAMSTWLPMARSLENELLTEEAMHTPILACHGTSDAVVAFQWGLLTSDVLKKAGLNVDFKRYPNMEHSACAIEIADVAEFISNRLSLSKSN